MSKWDSVIFGAKLRGKRAELGMNQSDLSKKIGVSFVTVSSYESGKTTPTSTDLPKIANALNLTPNEVFSWGVVDDCRADYTCKA